VTDPRRILIIRPSALGDVCRSVPVLASLRAAYPDATINWLVQDSFADAVRHHPMLDGVVEFPRASLGRSSKAGNLLPTISWMNQHLRTRPRYDLVIDAQGLFRSGLFARWTGARTRVGYRNAAEGARFFYTHAYGVDRGRHAVDRMLALVEACSVPIHRDMRLYADPAEQKKLSTTEWAGSRYAVLAPTSRWPGKQWPAERFTQLARRLLASGVDRIVIVGGPGEDAQIGPLLSWAEHEPRAINLVGETTIGGLMAVIERSSLVVANDSAALHMAVGFDRPLVALFGPTRVELVGPYRRKSDVIQHARPGDTFDHKDGRVGLPMMRRITVSEVAAACESRLGASPCAD
jgi:heptosyltransferase-1